MGVIKDPRTALWDSNTIGGVIQIFPQKLVTDEIAENLGFGNINQQQLSISGALDCDDGNTTFTAATKSADGYDAFDGAEDDGEGCKREYADFDPITYLPIHVPLSSHTLVNISVPYHVTSD